MSEKDKQDENQRRIAACLNALENIPTEKIEGKNLGEILAGELRLNNAGPRADGGFGFELSGGVCHLMAEGFAEQFKQSGAINYLELLFDHSDIGPLTITMQRVNGLTPAQKLAKAEKERDVLQQRLDAVLSENVALKKIAMDYANLADSRLSEMTADCESDCRRECYEFTNFTPATQSILNAVRADAVRQVVHEADGYEKQFQRDLTPAEWRTLVVNYFGVFDGLSRPIDTAKGGGDDKR